MSRTDSRSILVVAGEHSGEVHAGGLVNSLRRLSPELSFFGTGGAGMSSEGVELLADISNLAAIGPAAALANLWAYVKTLRRILQEVRRRRPSAAILVDFPDFNLLLARRLKRIGVPVVYFISPQLWAWRQSRVKQIRRNIDLMLVIFPFEEEFYRKQGVDAHYVGNPTAVRIEEREVSGSKSSGSLDLALLPGSRAKEIEQLLPVELDAAAYLQARRPVRVLLVKAPGVSRSLLDGTIAGWQEGRKEKLNLEIREEPTEDVLRSADCAIVKSGTSTLEALLTGVPFAMVYRLPLISWLLLRPLVKPQIFCLANLVAETRAVPEFVQWDCRGERVGEWMDRLLDSPERQEQMKRIFRNARERLGRKDAYLEAARLVHSKILVDRGQYD